MIVKINNFRSEVTDISAKKEARFNTDVCNRLCAMRRTGHFQHAGVCGAYTPAGHGGGLRACHISYLNRPGKHSPVIVYES